MPSAWPQLLVTAIANCRIDYSQQRLQNYFALYINLDAPRRCKVCKAPTARRNQLDLYKLQIWHNASNLGHKLGQCSAPPRALITIARTRRVSGVYVPTYVQDFRAKKTDENANVLLVPDLQQQQVGISGSAHCPIKHCFYFISTSIINCLWLEIFQCCFQVKGFHHRSIDLFLYCW